jgi:hypothetical protein
LHSRPTKDSSQYKSRKLTFEEANFVSSYYRQDGNNSAVTGGIGTEKLSDYSGSIDLKFSKWDRRNRKHSLFLEAGIDHYTSASSDNVDPHTISSASSADTRFYPSLSWTIENEKKGTTFGAGASISSEFDYKSLALISVLQKRQITGAANFQREYRRILITLNTSFRLSCERAMAEGAVR